MFEFRVIRELDGRWDAAESGFSGHLLAFWIIHFPMSCNH